jgi:hypothetical protein
MDNPREMAMEMVVMAAADLYRYSFGGYIWFDIFLYAVNECRVLEVLCCKFLVWTFSKVAWPDLTDPPTLSRVRWHDQVLTVPMLVKSHFTSF